MHSLEDKHKEGSNVLKEGQVVKIFKVNLHALNKHEAWRGART